VKCEHPDHNEKETCEDRAVSCHKDCACCAPYENRLQKCEHKHVTQTSGHGTEPAWVAVCLDCGAPLGKSEQGYYALPEHDPVQPPPGSWASVARICAQGDDSGFDWDAWKDEMKERDM
jgi:hypothetical protein